MNADKTMIPAVDKTVTTANANQARSEMRAEAVERLRERVEELVTMKVNPFNTQPFRDALMSFGFEVCDVLNDLALRVFQFEESGR